MAKLKARLSPNDALLECLTHDKKSMKQKPTNGCPICFCLWLHHKLETTIYSDDMDALIQFATSVRLAPIERVKDKERDNG
jgi:hypothetical protein